MPRIAYCDPSKLSEEARRVLGDRPANVSRMLAVASEPVFLYLHELAHTFINGSPLPPRLREVAILRVGYLSNSAYEVFQHEALARHVGLSDAQIAAIRAGDASAPALGEAEAAVLAFVDDLVKNVRAGDATLAAVRRHLDDAQLVDLILVSGAYMMISRLLETTGVEREEQPIDWSNMVPAR
jgi:4-carboxymuconolactone decarboxylase